MSEKFRMSAKSKDRIERLIERGTEMLGSGANAVTSGALALLVGSPEGLAIGGVLGKGVEIALNKVGQEISARQLAPREETRVGAAFAYAAAEINRRLEEGDMLRNDGFFDEKQAWRSDAEEVAESVLLKVQREPEEKKIPYMGNLFSSIAFEPEFNLPYSHQLIKVAEQVTYRQLCIFKLADVKEKHGLRDEFIHNQRKLGRNRYPVLYECVDLANKEYIYLGGETALGMGNAIPSQMSLQGIGADLFHLMRLCLIPDADIAPIAEQLK